MIPVLDLQGTPAKEARTIINYAFTQYGFLTVTNHGVEKALLDTAYEESKEFFALSRNEKMTYVGPGDNNIGYTPFGEEHAKDNQTSDLKEFFHLKNAYASSKFGTCYQLMMALKLKVSNHILYHCSNILGAPSIGELVQSTYDEPSNTVLRLLHYPPLQEGVLPSAVRASAHEDINLISLLVGATEPGLEVKSLDGQWVSIQAMGNDIIINVGDMLQNYSNGYFRSATHRVVNPSTSNNVSRYSMPLFVHPTPSFSLKPRPFAVQKTGGIIKYKDVTAGEYLNERLKEIGLIK